MESILDGLAICFLLAAGAWDLFRRRIPNALTLGTTLLALLISSMRGASFLLPSLKGMAFGLGLGLLPFALRMMGGGDVKSLGALGALIGASSLWAAFMGALAVGGVFGVLLLLPPHARHRADRGTGRSPWGSAETSAFRGFGSRDSIPFTTLLAASALAMILWRAF